MVVLVHPTCSDRAVPRDVGRRPGYQGSERSVPGNDELDIAQPLAHVEHDRHALLLNQAPREQHELRLRRESERSPRCLSLVLGCGVKAGRVHADRKGGSTLESIGE